MEESLKKHEDGLKRYLRLVNTHSKLSLYDMRNVIVFVNKQTINKQQIPQVYELCKKVLVDMRTQYRVSPHASILIEKFHIDSRLIQLINSVPDEGVFITHNFLETMIYFNDFAYEMPVFFPKNIVRILRDFENYSQEQIMCAVGAHLVIKGMLNKES